MGGKSSSLRKIDLVENLGENSGVSTSDYHRFGDQNVHHGSGIIIPELPHGTSDRNRPEKPLYPIPDYEGNNDEVDRLQLQHHLLRLAFGANFHAPVKDMLNAGVNVLDVGCGPATWSLEMATQYKKSMFVGIDMFRVFPKDCRPVNTTFYYSNILDGLPFADNAFDIVYQRDMCLGLSKRQWPKILRELVRVTKPGGYIELCEPDLEYLLLIVFVWIYYRSFYFGEVRGRGKGYARGIFINVIAVIHIQTALKIATSKGMDPHVGKNISNLLAEAGINNIQRGYVGIPMGHYGGREGKYMTDNFRELARQLKPVLLSSMKLSTGEYDQGVEQVFRSWDNNRSYFNVYWVYGQKPLVP
ncbi:S-adenosyl-L-methionine-dependent methyltransferase [Jimgerdemannia flammicorona]|uniref:S-adenosyl-L-methionine-dependent methyltransferase n=1 Tax=Jimgerdemannia flammicorona TaxID=994334 RepID=A0A433A1S4_9FUNG|nr:S-adenosyl-L-methionine-dependent methyltransferase [Jimgerdemannia flammicorona]